MKTVVVGASSGLGRCIATGLGAAGDQVAVLARRYDRLVDVAAEIGPGALPIECDVTDQASCRKAIEEAANGLGGIEGLVYAPGIGPLGAIEDLDADTWRRAFDTNVMGASLLTAAALPHLRASQGTAAYLSSVSAGFTTPWPGLAAYVATKAGLDKLIEAWRVEHPDIGFTRVVVGDCAGGEGDAETEFHTGWDLEAAGRFYPIWVSREFIAPQQFSASELVRMVRTVLSSDPTACVPSVTLYPRAPSREVSGSG